MTRGGGSRLLHATARVARCVTADPRLFARATAWRVVLPALKAAVPIGLLARWMDHSGTRRPVQRQTRIESLHRLLREGGRTVISGNCLDRSLLLYRLVSETGADAALVMGVRRDGADVKGHAWVELDGRPFRDDSARNFEPIQVWRPRTRAGHVGPATSDRSLDRARRDRR